MITAQLCRAAPCFLLGLLGSSAAAQDGFDWVTITHPGNAAFPGNHGNPKWQGTWEGRGSVGYEYRIARQEITTAQWAEFVNTFSTQAGFPATLWGTPSFASVWGVHWGAGPSASYPGPGTQWIYEDRGDWPVQGISWRDAALFCNWLHNGKSTSASTLWSGAYNTNTWNTVGIGNWVATDELTPQPSALFRIPTLDEWLKAAHFDPNRYGLGQQGWWRFANSSDELPVPGLPSEPGATTSAGLPFNFPPPWGVISIPLGAYQGQLSPWGLWDTAGGGTEWLQEPIYNGITGALVGRRHGGAFAGDGMYFLTSQAGWFEGGYPWWGSGTSLRLVSPVPIPATGSIFVCTLCALMGRRRTRRRGLSGCKVLDAIPCCGAGTLAEHPRHSDADYRRA